MKKLDKHIRELLFLYDCVIIPNFGGFICSFSPAKIHPVQHRFHPPGKKISFNKMLVMNDGLLAHHMAVLEKISYSDSLSIISEQVNQWNELLRKGQRFTIDGIGNFFNDTSGNLQFQYETNLNFLTDSYGLSTFQSLPIDRTKTMKVVHKSVSEEVEKANSLIVINKLAKYSVAAALLSVAMLTAYKMQLLKDVNLNTISLNPFNTEKAVYKSINYSDFEANDEKVPSLRNEVANSDETWIYYDAGIEGVDKKLKVRLKEVKKKSTSPTINYGKYHVVGGCFGVKRNAEKMVRKLQISGYKADMSITHNGLHVVSYESFQNENDARNFLQNVKSDHNSQAWLLVK